MNIWISTLQNARPIWHEGSVFYKTHGVQHDTEAFFREKRRQKSKFVWTEQDQYLWERNTMGHRESKISLCEFIKTIENNRVNIFVSNLQDLF